MPAKTVEQYLKQTAQPQKALLLEIRKIAAAVAPLAEQKIAWGMPCFYLEGGLIAFAAFKNHVSIFPMSGAVVDQLGAKVEKYRTSKGTIQLPLDRPLPSALVKQIVKLRLAENLAKASVIPVKNGKRHGRAREFYANGQLKAEGSWRLGELHGAWNWYRQDGTLMRSGAFKAGNQVGKWQTFDRAGRLVKTTEFGK